MRNAINVRSEKAYYTALKQLEVMGYKTPIHDFPTHMHSWNKFGRETVLFIEGNYITYQSTEYAKEEGYSLKRFKPSDDVVSMVEEVPK